MLTPFEKLSDNARIWIYQADRVLNASEQKEILAQTESFLHQWAAHGQALLASAKIEHGHFLIICTDESFNLASGCSIDSSVRFVQELGEQFKVNFFERSNLAFLINSSVKLVPMQAVKAEVANENIAANTLFFNNTVGTKAELDTKWCVKANESWLKRYFQQAESV
ncbi:hypothetical protein [Roseivirga pacifica]|uniref:hypothetical protein n=1 Tax=Roseivirga pacifica TaxID=1267423 RepID=UPI003BAAC654